MSVWEVVAVVGATLLLLNLLLTLRVLRWLRSLQEGARRDAELSALPELPVGEPPPPFRARDLSGRVVTSEDYAGGERALVFMSPRCGSCRRSLPALMSLADGAARRAGAQIVLVSDANAAETGAWIATVRQVDGVEITVPLLAAGGTSDFQARYNPRAVSPYFCHVDRDGRLSARGSLHSPEWTAVVRRWDSGARSARRAR